MFGNKVTIIGSETTTMISFSEEELGILNSLLDHREYQLTEHMREIFRVNKINADEDVALYKALEREREVIRKIMEKT